MKLERVAFLIALAAAAALAATSAQAQMTTAKPVVIKIKTPKPKKPKLDTFKGEVLHMDAISMAVRDPANTAIVKTFTYAPALSKKLQKLLTNGGYPYGERVTVKYADGTAVAQGISAKAPKRQ